MQKFVALGYSDDVWTHTLINITLLVHACADPRCFPQNLYTVLKYSVKLKLVTDTHTHTHTHSQIDYSNPRACAEG